MFKIEDDFVQDILSKTRSGEIKWNFENDWDVFYVEDGKFKLTLDHRIERSMGCDRLVLAIKNEKETNFYSSRLGFDKNGNEISNPAYDLLFALRQAVIANNNLYCQEVSIPILNCPLTLNSVLLENLANETNAGKLEWKFTRAGYICKSDKFGFSFDIEKDGLITVMLYVVGGETYMELYTPYSKEWTSANKLKDILTTSVREAT